VLIQGEPEVLVYLSEVVYDLRVEVTVNVQYLAVTVSDGSEHLGIATVVRYATCMGLRHLKHIAAPLLHSCSATLRQLVLALYARHQ